MRDDAQYDSGMGKTVTTPGRDYDYEDVMRWAHAAALIKTRCGWCELVLRPCNLARHVAAKHYKQLTIDVLAAR